MTDNPPPSAQSRIAAATEQVAQVIADNLTTQLEIADKPDRYAEWIDPDAIAAVVLASLNLTEEDYTYEAFETRVEMGGEGNMRYGGQTTRSIGFRTKRRLVTPWVVSGE